MTTTTYKSKAELKAEQKASQDAKSQDSIPVIEGLESSLEALYQKHRNEAHVLAQTVRFRAYKDELEAALCSPKIDEGFLSNLSKNYSPVALNHVPTLLLTQSGADAELDALCVRNDELVEKEGQGTLTTEESEELAQLQAKLKDLGIIK